MKATVIVNFAGQDTPACDEHATKLRILGDVMGFNVSSTPCGDGIDCKKCEYEGRIAPKTE